jgi:NAD(P)H-nitrite reductase large subunit
MDPDDHVCLCFHVSKRKIVNYYRRERPAVASMINRELPAGTGCQWCVPFVKTLHRQVMADEPEPDLPFSPAEYAKRRTRYRATGQREPEDGR